MDIDDILMTIREELEEDNLNRLIAEIEYEEDMMYLNDPRAHGPDRDADEGPWYWEN